MVKPDLLGSDDEGDESKIVINKRYAKDFQIRKQREDLRNNAALSYEDEDDASTSSSEDEDGALLTTKLDTDIMKTINALRSKDSRIYDPNVRFFPSDEEELQDGDLDSDEEKSDKKRTKPKRYKDVVREQALEQMEKGIDDEDEDDNDRAEKSHRLAYDKEQEDIRNSFLKSTGGFADSEESEKSDSELLIVKKKYQKDEADEKEFIEEVKRIESNLQKEGKSDYVDPKGEVDDGSKFLLNYFKNRSWIDRDADEHDSEDDIESFTNNKKSKKDEVERDEVLPMKKDDGNDGNESDASLDQLDKTDDFEAQYNFRFEEAAASQSGADFSLISYARGQTVNTLRRKDDTRREKRLARKERKAAERRAKEEELKRLKNLKRKEMERKLNEVKKVIGLADEHDTELDETAILKLIEGDYDPEEFEQKMQETFGDDFYSKEDKEWKSDKDVREALLKDEDGNLIVGQDKEGDMYDTVEDDVDADADADADATEDDGNEDWGEDDFADEQGDGNGEDETSLERKIKSKMEDELYKLDYEDIIAGMPTRFKYRQVEPNDYGLTTEEILFARDTTLKQFVSLKKMAPYREDGEFNAGGRRRRRFRELLKHELEEVYQQNGGKEAKKVREGEEEETGREEETQQIATEDTNQKKRKRRRSKKSKSNSDERNHEKQDDGLQGAGPEPKEMDKNTDAEAKGADVDTEPKRKRRRRNKKNKKSSPGTQEPAQATSDESNSKKADSVSKAATESRVSKRSPETTVSDKTGDGADLARKLLKETKKVKDKEKKKAKKDDKIKHRKDKDGKRREKKKKSQIVGISSSRLSSYGL